MFMKNTPHKDMFMNTVTQFDVHNAGSTHEGICLKYDLS